MQASKLGFGVLAAGDTMLAGCASDAGHSHHGLTFHSSGPGWACKGTFHAAIDVTVQDAAATVIGSASNVHGTDATVPNGAFSDDACDYKTSISVPDTAQYIISWNSHGSADSSTKNSTESLTKNAVVAKGWKP